MFKTEQYGPTPTVWLETGTISIFIVKDPLRPRTPQLQQILRAELQSKLQLFLLSQLRLSQEENAQNGHSTKGTRRLCAFF